MTKELLIAEAKSLLTTLLAIMLIDGAGVISQIANGDYSKAAWATLGFLAVRSLVKVIIKRLWPNLPVGAKKQVA